MSTKSSFFTSPLHEILPKKVRRFILLSSLFGVIERTSNPDKTLLNKLNSALRIADSSSSMVVPAMVGKLIWRNASFGNIYCTQGSGDQRYQMCIPIQDLHYQLKSRYYDNHQIKGLASSLLEKTPGWLLYGTKSQVRQDFVTLLEQMQIA